MKSYNPTEFAFQTEWVEKRGLWLVMAFFLGGLGGGLYLVSLYLNYLPGIVTAFFIVAVGKGGTHLLYLGKPLRFWRAFLKPQTSWISRGIISVAGFVLFVGLQLLPEVPGFSFLPWTMHSGLIQGLAIASAVLLIAYTGFALGVVNSIPFWNTALMPLLFIIYSLLGGTGLTLGLLLGTGNTVINIEVVEAVARWFLLTAIVIVGAYLWISYHVNPVAKYSVFQLIKGRVSPYFIGGVLVLGLAVPVTVTALELVYNLPYTVMLSGVACELIGGFSLRYTILKAGAYTPLV